MSKEARAVAGAVPILDLSIPRWFSRLGRPVRAEVEAMVADLRLLESRAAASVVGGSGKSAVQSSTPIGPSMDAVRSCALPG